MNKKLRNTSKSAKRFKKPKRMLSHAKNKIKKGRIHTKSWYKSRSLIQKIIIVIIVLIVFLVSCMYGIARWYIAQNSNRAMHIGVTFVPRYARYYDLDPQQTMRAFIDELGIRQFRLVSYWDDYEPLPNQYNFNELDWQFKFAEESNSKISLAIGLRQPRWPECHMPNWAKQLPKEQWSQHLKEYMRVVIERYKNSPALESYQLENEYFLKVFGECPDFSRDRLIDEYNFVKQLDSSKPIIISRSNNAIGLPIGEPTPDISAVSVYKRVWDKTLTKRYFEYPFPAWFYGFLAGAGKIINGNDMIIHELQAEPWAPTETKLATIEEQDKSLDAKRLRHRFTYGEATGMREMYLWGAEWWYWRKIAFHDNSIWDVAKQEIKRLQKSNNNCGMSYNKDFQRPPC